MRLWIRDVNDNTLADLLDGTLRSDHNSRPCLNDDCNDLHKIKGGCPHCTDLSVVDLRTAHPTVFSRTGVVDCPALLHGDVGAQKVAKDYLNEHLWEKGWSSADYVHAANNCSQFRRMRGYVIRPLSQEEADFPIAFSILMYSNVQQVYTD